MVNRKMKRIVLLEFKRKSDSSESYYQDMRKVSGKYHTPILRVGSSQDLWDRDRRWEEIHPQTRVLYFIFTGYTFLDENEKILEVTVGRHSGPPVVYYT